MTHNQPELHLRHFTAAHAAAFGALLLIRAEEEDLHFDHFLAAALDFLGRQPRHAAEYLAALVAIDMRRECVEPPGPRTAHAPSAN